MRTSSPGSVLRSAGQRVPYPGARITNMCSVCDDFETRAESDALAGILKFPQGAVAQLVERVHGMDEVARSIRVGSTISPEGFVLGGFVAGEGSFSVTQRKPPYSDGRLRKRFVFSVTVASRLPRLRADPPVPATRFAPRRRGPIRRHEHPGSCRTRDPVHACTSPAVAQALAVRGLEQRPARVLGGPRSSPSRVLGPGMRQAAAGARPLSAPPLGRPSRVVGPAGPVAIDPERPEHRS